MRRHLSYRERLYEVYVSTHTLDLLGEATDVRIRREFSIWTRRFGKFLPENKEIEILDIGCGRGEFVSFLQNYGYRKAEGVDISPQQIEKARTLGIRNVHKDDIGGFLKRRRDCYDIIFARDIIEHFKKEEVLQILDVIFYSLKQQGILVIQTVNGESPLAGRYLYGDFTHENAFTKSSLNQLLKAVGFVDLRFYRAGPAPIDYKSAIRYFLWRILELLIKCYIRIEAGPPSGIYTQNIIATAKKLL